MRLIASTKPPTATPTPTAAPAAQIQNAAPALARATSSSRTHARSTAASPEPRPARPELQFHHAVGEAPRLGSDRLDPPYANAAPLAMPHSPRDSHQYGLEPQPAARARRPAVAHTGALLSRTIPNTPDSPPAP